MAEPQETAIARFRDHAAVEGAVRSLERSGVPTDRISVLGRDFQSPERVQGFVVHPQEPERRAVAGEVRRGALWGGLFELLVGVGFFVVPGFGSLVALGPFSQLLIRALGEVSLGALSGALSSLGLSREEAHRLHSVLRAGEFLCVVNADKAQVDAAAKVLQANGAIEVKVVAGGIPT
jgi:hypothetical protein